MSVATFRYFVDKHPALRLLDATPSSPNQISPARSARAPMSNPPSSSNALFPGSTPDPAQQLRPICPICKRTPDRMPLSPAPWRVAWCGDCHFLYIANPPAYEAVKEE